MNYDTIQKLSAALQDIPNLVKRFGKDGECIRIFVDEWKEKILATKDVEQIRILLEFVPMLLLKALEGIRTWKFYNPNTYDIFKPMRIKADEIAEIMGFSKYLERRRKP